MNIDTSKERAGSSSPVAERMRLYRQRWRQGIQYARIPLHVTKIDEFIKLGLLKEDQRQNAEALGALVLNLVQQVVEEIRDAHARYG